MNKKILLIIIYSLLHCFAYSQKGVINSGGKIVIKSGAILYIDGGNGADYINQTNTDEGRILLNGKIKLTGDWENNAANTVFLSPDANGEVIFMGGANQTIEGSSSTLFENIVLNNTNGVNLAGVTQTVAYDFEFVSGKLLLNDQNLHLNNGATITGYTLTKYFDASGDGMLYQYHTGSTVLYPVGINTIGYVPVSLNNNSGTNDFYGIRVFNDVYVDGTSNASGQIANYANAVEMSWVVGEYNASGSNLTVTPQWNSGIQGGSFDLSNCGVGYHNGSDWIPQQGSDASGSDPYTRTRSGLTGVGVFAVGDFNTVLSDGTPPTLSNVHIESNNGDPTIANEGHTVTLDFTASETLSTNPTVTFYSGGVKITQTTPYINKTGLDYEYSYKVNLGDTDGKVTFYITFADISGNAGDPVYEVTDASEVTVDKTASFPTAWVDGPTTVCAGDELSFAVASGTAPYTIKYEKGGTVYTVTGITASPYDFTAGGNGSGTFEITDVIDNNGNHANVIGPPKAFTINPLPTVSFTMTKTLFGMADTEVLLTLPANATISPTGGTFSGTGVTTSDSKFRPTVAGVGEHIITYSYTDANSCTNTAEDEATVIASTTRIEFTPDNEIDNVHVYCDYNNSAIEMQGINDFSEDGDFELWTIEATPVDKTSELTDLSTTIPLVDKVSFIPSDSGLGVGKYRIIYSGASFTVSEDIEISHVDQPSFDAFDDSFCKDDDADDLFVNNPETGGTKTFLVNSGTVAGFVHPVGTDKLTVTPDDVLAYGTYTVEYVFTSEKGCKTVPIEKDITINPLPVVDFVGLHSNYNVDGPPIQLKGNYSPAATEQFLGLGVSNGILYPNLVTSSPTDLTYRYKNPTTGCQSETIESVEILKATGNINNLNATYCYGDAPFEVDYTPLSTTGTFSSYKNGITTPTINNKATYDPTKAGAGHDTLKFTYYIDGTEYIKKEVVFIDQIGDITFDLDPVYCAYDDDHVIESDVDHDSGSGTFSEPAPGFTDNGDGTMNFEPDNVTAGVQYTIDFTYTSTKESSGCKKTLSKKVRVDGLPEVDLIGLKSNYNVNGPPVTLVGNHSPSTDELFYGTGIVNDVFYPSSVGLKKDHELGYQYTDPVSGCVNQTVELVDIIQPEGTIKNLNKTYCYGDDDVIIEYQSTTPGITGNFSSKNAKITSSTVNNRATYSPSKKAAGPDTIYFSYYIEGTLYQIYQRTFIDSIGEVSFDVDDAFCAGSEEVEVNARVFHESGIANFNEPGKGFSNFGLYAKIDPSIAEPKDTPYKFTFTYQSTLENSGCEATFSKDVKIDSIPNVQIIGLKSNYNVNEQAVELVGNYSPEGVFSGQGIVDNKFYPNLAGVKSDHPITYTYTFPVSGCNNSITQMVDIREATGSINGLVPVFCYSDSIYHIWYKPESGQNISGTFTSHKGAIVSQEGLDAYYSLVEAGSGHDTVTFTYLLGETEYKVSQNIYIDSIGEVDFDTDTVFCAGSELITVYSRYNHPGGEPKFNEPTEGFTNYGNNVVIEPGVIRPRMQAYPLTFTYTSSMFNSGCKVSKTKDIYVYPVPHISFSLDENYNVNAPPVKLNGKPEGGTYYGFGVSGDLFYPAVAGSGFGLEIEYTYIDSLTGCGSVIVESTNVLKADAAIEGLPPNNTFCYAGGKDTITGFSLNGIPGGEFIGDGINNIAPDKAIFDPVSAGKGEHDITYKYLGVDGITVFEYFETVFVDSVGKVTISGLDESYCEQSAGIQIFGNKGSEGRFSGPGVVSGQGFAWFYPSLAGTQDSPHKIAFEYVAESGCRADTIVEVVIHPLPEIDFALKNIYNLYEVADTLKGNPVGGDFFGRGIIPDDNTFHPDFAGIGAEINISYIYTDNNGCTATKTKQTSVESAQGQLIGINSNNIYCYEALPDTFRAETNNGKPGGQFTGNGLIPIGQDEVIFDPKLAGNGEHLIKYTYQSIDAETSFELFTTIIVDSIGKVEFVGLDEAYCADAEQAQLNAIAPSGGKGEFNGIEHGFIDAGKIAWLIPEEITPQSEPYVLTFKYTSEYGCEATFKDSTYVHPLPESNFDIQNSFCANEPEIELIGSPQGGEFLGANIINTDAGATFKPDLSIVGTNTITYEFIDESTQCANQISYEVEIFDVPPVSIDGINENYCINDQDIALTGLVRGFKGFGDFSGNGVDNAIENDGEALFIPKTANIGQHIISFEYIDRNGCVSSTDTAVTVNELPSVSLLGLNEDKSYCSYVDVNPVILNGIHLGTGGKDEYFANEEALQGGILDPKEYVGKTFIEYHYTDSKGCKNIHYDSIEIHPVPVVDFEVPYKCLPDSIKFVDKTESEDPITLWEWNFGDNTPIERYTSASEIKHHYIADGDKIVNLAVSTGAGCSTQKSQVITLSHKPEIDFTWNNECFGSEPIKFIANANTEIEQWQWDFGDGNTSNIKLPEHNYPSDGSFDVELIALENKNQCADTAFHTVHIRPYIKFYDVNNQNVYSDYYEDFEEGSNGWVSYAEALETNTWKLDKPDGDVINKAFSGETAWYTDLSSIAEPENSWITSPCFDFSELKRPMLKLQIWPHTNEKRDGAVIQYLEDSVWINLGTIGEGVNWYNTAGIYGNPGEQKLGQEGWSQMQSENWIEARQRLDHLIGKDKVRFRIAYGSDGGSASDKFDGVAFDDIWIGERKKLVLLEHFTNSTELKCAQVSPIVNTIVNTHIYDIVDIQYHTSFPKQTEFNLQNQEDPSARSLYYGINQVPQSVIDGSVYNNVSATWIDTTLLKNQTLKEPQCDIELITNKTENTINIETKVIPKETLENTSVYIAVVEKEITAIVGENGETKFENVMKKMLPDAGGTNYTSKWYAGDAKRIVTSWNFKNVYDPSKLRVIVFVQNEVTKEVYQATTNDVDLSTGINYTSTKPFEAGDFTLYPNPASDITYILFDKPIAGDFKIQVFNTSGQLLIQEKILKGMSLKPLNTSNLKYGLYFIKLISETNEISSKKLIITR